MRIVQATSFGGPEVLGVATAPDPVAGPGQAVVRVADAHVIAAARGSRKLGRARELGAEVTVDYCEPGWPQNVLTATAGTRPDVVFDGAGTHLGQAAFTITAEGGPR